MSLDSITIIIRSVGERTEAICKKLILEQGVPENAIHIINEAPFSKAMKVGFEIGIQENRHWTFCVDADLLLRPGSISKMIELGDNMPKNVCEIQGFILDKFYGGARMGGAHVYRTEYLKNVIERIPEEGKDIRPESHALEAMKDSGFPWVSVNELVGLHDFEQRYEDIFRKCFIHAIKHQTFLDLFIPLWKSRAFFDKDYQVALSGLAAGIEYIGEVRIDFRADYLETGLKRIGFDEKLALDINFWDLQAVEKVIQEWIEPEEYWEKYPSSMLGHGKGIISKSILQFNRLRKKQSISSSALAVIGRIIESIGRQLKG